MNQNLYQRILFATFLFFSFQAILIFVEMPLYFQLFFMLLTFGFAGSFFSLFLMKPSSLNELSMYKTLLIFLILWGLTFIYQPNNQYHNLVLEFLFKTASFISFYKNMEFILPQKVNLGVSIVFYAFNHAMNHFLLNNLFTFSLAFAIIRTLKPKNIKQLAILMFLSIVYESYWVYFDEKIVNLLISVNGPIKILFPFRGGYSFIAIFDIIVPGIVLNFALNFDCFRLGVKERENLVLLDEKNIIYFNFIFCSYFVGLLTLNSVITNTHKNQSFLCYSLISCGLGFWFLGSRRGEMHQLRNFEWGSEKNVSEYSLKVGEINEKK